MTIALSSPTVYVAVGRRKDATARVRLQPGTGQVQVNGQPADEYFTTEQSRRTSLQPLQTAEKAGEIDVIARVNGGGNEGQAVAVAHGIARALLKYNGDLRPVLKKAGHLTRDPRMKERKKSGQPGARKRFQFSKR